MKIPRGDLLIQRSLSHQNREGLLIDKKPSQKEKPEDTDIFLNTQDFSKNKENEVSFDSIKKKTHYNLFFYCQEFISTWITQLAVRPTHLNTILSVTIYFIAISSTIQRREGTRWLQFLLQAKLPGYSAQYQEISWESFRSSTGKNLLAKTSNVNPYTFQKQNKKEKVCIADTRQNLASTFRANALERSPYLDLYKDKAFIYLRSPWEKQIRKDFVGFFAHRRRINVTDATANTSIFQNKSKETLFEPISQAFLANSDKNQIVLPWYRIDACNKWDRLLVPKLQNEKTSQNQNNLEKSNPYSAHVNTNGDSLQTNSKTLSNNKSNNLFRRRASSRLVLLNAHKNQTQHTLHDHNLKTTVTQLKQATSLKEKEISSFDPIKNKIKGWSYILFLGGEKERVYTENDSIPFKLESPYLTRIFGTNGRNNLFSFDLSTESVSGTNRENLYTGHKTSIVLPRIGFVSYSISKNKLIEFVDKNNENLPSNHAKSAFERKQVEIDLSFFQSRLRELFYLSGFTPPYDWTRLIDKRLTQSKIQVSRSKDISEESNPIDKLKDLENDELKQLDISLKKDKRENPNTSISNTNACEHSEAMLDYVNASHPTDASINVADARHSFASPLQMHKQLQEKEINENAISYLLNHNTFPIHQEEISPCISYAYASDALRIMCQQAPLAEHSEAMLVKQMQSLPHTKNVDVSKTSNKALSTGKPNRKDEFQNQTNNSSNIEDFVHKPGSKEIKVSKKNSVPFAFKNWPLQLQANQFTLQSGTYKGNKKFISSSNRFQRNNIIRSRFMSGYKFPDLTKSEIHYLFKRFVLPHLLVSCGLSFAPSYLINQIVLRALYIKLPPIANSFFFKNLALSLEFNACEHSEAMLDNVNVRPPNQHFKQGFTESSHLLTVHKESKNKDQNSKIESNPEYSDINLEYKRITLQEYKQVKDTFSKLARDFEEYLTLPKDSPPAIRISPSLQDDTSLQLQAEQKEKRDDERSTSLERLQKLRRREQKFELGKELRPFAYKNELAKRFERESRKDYNNAKLLFEKDDTCDSNEKLISASARLSVADAPNTLMQSKFQQTPFLKKNFWIDTKLGSKNMRSDRRYNFFGRKNLLTKRLVAQEQRELNNQILKDSYSVSQIHLLPNKHFVNEIGIKSVEMPKDVSTQDKKITIPRHLEDNSFTKKSTNLSKDLPQNTSTNNVLTQRPASLKEKIDIDKREDQHSPQDLELQFQNSASNRSDAHQLVQATQAKLASHHRKIISHKKLQRRARKGLIKLLASPELSARNLVGAQNRTRKPNRALLGKVIPTAYSHLRWQKKRFSSRMLSTPCKRHLVMPEITHNDWNKILEWQLKNYFFLEEKRLEPLIKENPEKDFKVKQVHLYLPWVTIRTNTNRPFQWPLTRLDYADFGPWNAYKDASFSLPLKKDVHYLDSGKSVSLSFTKTDCKSRYKLMSSAKNFFKFKGLFHIQNPFEKKSGSFYEDAPSKHVKDTTFKQKDGIRTRTLHEPYLCEPLTNQSWLLIYRLFLAFALKHGIKYVYRVSLKDFIIRMANSDFGLMMTSPEFREWLENAPSQSSYTPFKRLQDIAAIEDSIPTLSEMVWYLRNSGRGRAGCRGLLLVGPAGAEKTSVVQAIAGECGRPVIVQSMSALALSYQEPYERLENVFSLARKNAPCVLFLDNLDAIGQSRAHVVTNDIGSEDSLFSLDAHTAEGRLALTNCSNELHTSLLPKPNSGQTGKYLSRAYNPLATNPVYGSDLESSLAHDQAHNTTAPEHNGKGVSTFQQNPEFQARRLNLLLRLLTLMDGIAPLNGVLIVATSEQPALLDPALVRAGRFERRVFLSLPNQERRIQLFKLATRKIGSMPSIPWNYFGLCTTNMSGADIASAINHSAIRAILDNTIHTVETLEHGLNCVTGVPNKRFGLPNLHSNKPFNSSRLAYYQSGRAIVYNLLPGHPQLGSCHLNDFVSNQGGVLNGNGNSSVSNGGITTMQLKQELPLQRETLQVVIPSSVFSASSQTKSSPTGTFKHNLHSQSINNLPFNRLRNRSVLKKGFPIFTQKSNSNKSNGIQSREQGETTFSARTRVQFETRLVGLYAGKAAELLHLSSNVVPENSLNVLVKYASTPQNGIKNFNNFSNPSFSKKFKKRSTEAWYWQSNLGFSDLLTASSLIHLMVDRWYLYSQKILHYKINRLVSSLNHEQLRDETIFPLAKRLNQELQRDSIKSNFWGMTSDTSEKLLQIQSNGETPNSNELSLNKQVNQERIRTHWWQAKICQALEMGERPYGKWYRIYLPKIEEREQNEEWVPPDSIVHQSLGLSNLTATKRFRFVQSNKFQKDFSSSHTKVLDHALHANFNKSNNRETGLEQEAPEQGLTSAKNTNLSHAYTNSKKRFRFIPLPLQVATSRVQHHNALKTFNDLYLFERDHAYQNAVMNSFYEAFSILNENRELLDIFADHLIRYQILRAHEISKICSLFEAKL